MRNDILFRIITLLIIVILFVIARNAERNKKYKTSFTLYILMAILCLVMFFGVAHTNL